MEILSIVGKKFFCLFNNLEFFYNNFKLQVLCQKILTK